MNNNFSMLMDLYELTMSNAYFLEGKKDQIVYFDMFFRKVPDGGGFAITAGLSQMIEYIKNLHFTEEDIEYLKSLNTFDDGFLDYLRTVKFTGDIWAIEEGMPVFPGEPLVTVRAPIIEAQLIETMILLNINHQSLIATKSNRIVRSAIGIEVIEFGARRAQGRDGAYIGARASYIGGCVGTSNVLTGKLFDIPVYGTMAHSWIQLFDSDYEAFKTYARTYPDKALFLIDTYDTLKSGLPAAIKVFKEEVVTRGFRPIGVRLDSGDLAYLSKEVRKELDEAGFKDAKILASNSLDEYVVADLKNQGACIDMYGIGEKLITASSDAVFGGVYKLVAVDRGDHIQSKIKKSENVEKITTPGFKQVYRLYDKKTSRAQADLITLRDEVLDDTKPYTLFDPIYTWKKTEITDFYAEELLKPIFIDGKCIYEQPSLKEIKEKCQKNVDLLWDGVKRLQKPHRYFVDLSKKLWDLKRELLEQER